MKIGFIGLGNMATAMIGGMLGKGLVESQDVIGSSKTSATAEKIKTRFNITTVVLSASNRRNPLCREGGDPCGEYSGGKNSRLSQGGFRKT